MAIDNEKNIIDPENIATIPNMKTLVATFLIAIIIIAIIVSVIDVFFYASPIGTKTCARSVDEYVKASVSVTVLRNGVPLYSRVIDDPPVENFFLAFYNTYLTKADTGKKITAVDGTQIRAIRAGFLASPENPEPEILFGSGSQQYSPSVYQLANQIASASPDSFTVQRLSDKYIVLVTGHYSPTTSVTVTEIGYAIRAQTYIVASNTPVETILLFYTPVSIQLTENDTLVVTYNITLLKKPPLTKNALELIVGYILGGKSMGIDISLTTTSGSSISIWFVYDSVAIEYYVDASGSPPQDPTSVYSEPSTKLKLYSTSTVAGYTWENNVLSYAIAFDQSATTQSSVTAVGIYIINDHEGTKIIVAYIPLPQQVDISAFSGARFKYAVVLSTRT